MVTTNLPFARWSEVFSTRRPPVQAAERNQARASDKERAR